MEKIHPTARYNRDGLMFICSTAEERDALEARGWKDSPPPSCTPVWVKRFDEIPADEPAKPERVVGADTDGDGVIDRPFAKGKSKKK